MKRNNENNEKEIMKRNNENNEKEIMKIMKKK
jgi:hypothetical protein